MSFLTELKRRNVFKVGVAYAIVAWLVIQIVATVFPILALPDWTTRFITIVIIIGFPLAILLAWIYELTPEGIKVTTSAGPDQYHTQTTGQRLNYFIIGVLVLVVAFMVVDIYVLKESPEVVEKTSNTSTVSETISPEIEVEEKAKPAAPPNSIAVLPFADMSPDRDQDYFADGIAEELLNSLARIKDLEVRGRTSSFYFKGRNEDLQTISKLLNVKYLLEGSVRKAGNQVRITVQMINTQSDEHLWSKTYDRELTDIFTIQDEIAESVATALSITLGVGELGSMAGGTRNLAAYEAYLQGQYQFQLYTPESILQAIEHYTRAVELDPDYALAWVGLARCYNEYSFTFSTDTQDYAAKTAAAFKRARELAPDLLKVLVMSAERSAYSGDYLAAENILKEAMANSSASDVVTLEGYSQFLLSVGRATEAIPYLERIRRIDPLRQVSDLAEAYARLGRYNEALAEVERLLKLPNAPEYMMHGTGLVFSMASGDRVLVDKWLAEVIAREPPGLNIVMEELIDDPEAALTELQRVHADLPASASNLERMIISYWVAYFGDLDFALAILQTVYPDKAKANPLLWRPIWKDLRTLPGFKQVVIDLGLVDYWRTTGNWGDFCHPVGDNDFECN